MTAPFNHPSLAVGAAPARSWPRLMGVGSVAMMSSLAGDRGLVPERILAGSGLTGPMLQDADTTIHITQEIAVARNLLAGVDDAANLGITLARRYRVTLYGAFGWGLLCAPTLREQLSFGARFAELSYACCQVTWSQRGGRLHFRVDDGDLPTDVRRFFRDRTMGALITLLGDILPPGQPVLAIRLAEPESSACPLYRSCFDAPIRFDQPANEIVIGLERQHERTPTANELTFAQAQAECRDLLDRRRRPGTTRDQVQQHQLRRLPDVPTIAEVAAGLHLSERTLRRRLEEENTSFTEILDTTRRALAVEWLGRGTPPCQVAVQLGFSSHSAFTHAFTRWYGKTPREFVASSSRAIERRALPELAVPPALTNALTERRTR